MNKTVLTVTSFLFVTTLLTGGCADVSEYVVGEDNILPAELTKFKQTLNVKLAWSTQINAISERHESRIDPVEIDGVIFIAEPEGRVVAHDAKDGKLIWEKILPGSISGGIGKAEGLLLLGTDNADVIALDTKNGETRWSLKVTSEILSAPLMYEHIAIVYSGDGVISAIDSRSGERVWAHRNRVPSLSLRGTSTPFIAGDRVYVGLSNGKLIALDVRNGNRLWETTIAIAKGRSELERIVDLDGAVRMRDGVIYIASYQGRLAAVNADNGRIVWVRDLSSYQSLEIGESELYFTDNQSRVWSLDKKSGATLWRQNKLQGRILTGPAIQSDYIAIGDYQGFIHWLKREDGDIVARQDLQAANLSAAVVGSVTVEDYYYVVCNFDFKDVAGILSTPLVIGNMLYVADKGGVLAAYRIGNGV